MLQIGKYQPHQHKEIAQEIRNFFAADPNRIAHELFAMNTNERPSSVLDDDVFALCLRGARFRLIGEDPLLDDGGEYAELEFARFLGFNHTDEIATFNNENAFGNRRQNIINLLDEKLAA